MAPPLIGGFPFFTHKKVIWRSFKVLVLTTMIYMLQGGPRRPGHLKLRQVGHSWNGPTQNICSYDMVFGANFPFSFNLEQLWSITPTGWRPKISMCWETLNFKNKDRRMGLIFCTVLGTDIFPSPTHHKGQAPKFGTNCVQVQQIIAMCVVKLNLRPVHRDDPVGHKWRLQFIFFKHLSFYILGISICCFEMKGFLEETTSKFICKLETRNENINSLKCCVDSG